MSHIGITDKSFHLLINTFSSYPEVEQVIIFGSRAKGNFKKGSDIDLTIKGNCHYTPTTITFPNYCLQDILLLIF